MTPSQFLWAALLLMTSVAAVRVYDAEAQSTGASPGSIIYSDYSNSLTFNTGRQSYMMQADMLTAPSTLTVARSKDCRLVVLEDTADKLVIGCRKELAR